MEQFNRILSNNWMKKVKELEYATVEDPKEAGCVHSFRDCMKGISEFHEMLLPP